MRILAFLIALAAFTPAYADTFKSTFDYGPARPDRVAVLALTCDCEGAQSVSINGVALKRDTTTGGSQPVEVWSAPLPEGTGVLDVTISSDQKLSNVDTIMGAVVGALMPESFRAAEVGRREYSLSVEPGDSVLHVARSADSYPVAAAAPVHQLTSGKLQATAWDIDRETPAFVVSGPSAVSAVVVYR